MSKKQKLPSLEKALAELSTVLEKMEHGELTLEQSLEQFEQGITLIRHARSLLEQAEQKITFLTAKS